VSAQLTWRALDEADQARMAANRRAFVPQTQTFSAQAFFSPCTLPQDRYNYRDSRSKTEILVYMRDAQ
jgi:hypothetical protein